MGPIEQHDMELCRELLWTSGALRAGDLVLEDRGFLDGESLSYLKGGSGRLMRSSH